MAGTARAIIAISTFAALLLNLVLVSRAWSVFLTIPIAATIVALVAHRRWPGVTRGSILFLAGVTPALVRVWYGVFDLTDGGTWLLPLLAVTIADTGLTRWHMPRLWVLPLAFWGLCIAASWPIVIVREADFALGALRDYQTSVSVYGIPVPVQAAWIAHVAALQMTAILWVDGLFARYAGARPKFEREVVMPIAIAVLVSLPIALYQAAYDASFLDPTTFGGIGRAAGLLLDANVFGIMAAMFIPAIIVLTYRRDAVWGALGILAALVCLAAVWGSGSRTALLGALCTLPLVAAGIINAPRPLAARLVFLGATLLLFAALGVVAWSGRLSGPVDRVKLVLERSWAAGESVVEYLWKRDGYGPSALRMIEEHPLPGVGVGTFHALVLDYSRRDDPMMGVSTDNAQNWVRHEVAEKGAIGSLGVLIFAAILAVSVLRPAQPGRRTEAWLIASAMAGVAAASLMGVPLQHPYPFITFWVFVAWHRIVSARDTGRLPAPRSRWAWTGVFALALVFGGLTLEAARDELRPPHRAARFGWPYLRGYHRTETGTGTFRWTRQQSKAVIPAQAGYLQLSYFVHHSDAATNPVGVKILVDGRIVVDEQVTDLNAHTVYVPVAPGTKSLTIETSVSRPWFPPHEGGTRELGLGLADWVFVYRPPDDAIIR